MTRKWKKAPPPPWRKTFRPEPDRLSTPRPSGAVGSVDQSDATSAVAKAIIITSDADSPPLEELFHAVAADDRAEAARLFRALPSYLRSAVLVDEPPHVKSYFSTV